MGVFLCGCFLEELLVSFGGGEGLGGWLVRSSWVIVSFCDFVVYSFVRFYNRGVTVWETGGRVVSGVWKVFWRKEYGRGLVGW